MSKSVEKIDLVTALAQSAVAASASAEQCERNSFGARSAGDGLALTYYESHEEHDRGTYLGLKTALAYLRAETPDAVMVQLCAARDLAEHLSELSTDEYAGTASELKQSLRRLLTSAILAIEDQSGRKLEDAGLWRLRARYLDVWETPAACIAAARRSGEG